MTRRIVLIMFALFLAEMTSAFEATMVFAALPKLIGIFGDASSAGWLVTIHMLVAAGTAIVAARMGDLRGRKRVMIVLLAIAGIGSVVSALSTSYAMLLLGRGLQGAIGAMLPLGIGVVRANLPPARVPLGVGIILTSQGAGSAAGLVLGGAIIDNLDWHWLFGASAILLFVSLCAVWAFVPNQPGVDSGAKVDWLDGIIPVPCITALVLALTLSRPLGWTDWRVLGLIAAGLVGVAWWARRSLASANPFVDLRLLTNRNVAIGNMISALLSLGTLQLLLIFSTLMQAPRWTMAGLGLSATVAGLAKLPSNILSFTAGPLAGVLAQARGHRATLVLGALFIIAGWSAALTMPESVVEVVLMLCLISFGTTFLMTGVPNLLVASVPDARTGETIALLSVLRGMVMAIGSQIIAMWLASEMVGQTGGTARFPAASAYQWAIGWIVGLSLLVLLLALAVRPAEVERTEAAA